MLNVFTYKDRVFLASVFVLVIIFWMAVPISARSMILRDGLALYAWQYGYIIAMSIISGMGSIALVCLTLYQFRQTGLVFFRWLWAAYALDLIKYTFIIFQAFNPELYESHAQLVSRIQTYAIETSSVIIACILLYAFATFSPGGPASNRSDRLYGKDIVVLVLATIITLSFCILPVLLSPGGIASQAISANRISAALCPVILLWLNVWQYRRSENPFFKYFAWGFAMAVLVFILENSGWYFSWFGISNPFSFVSGRLGQKTALALIGIKTILILGMLSLQAYATAVFKFKHALPDLRDVRRSYFRA